MKDSKLTLYLLMKCLIFLLKTRNKKRTYALSTLTHYSGNSNKGNLRRKELKYWGTRSLSIFTQPNLSYWPSFIPEFLSDLLPIHTDE